MFTGSTIGIHAQRRATSSKVDVRSGEDGTGSGITPQILAHGMIAINSAGSITQTAVRKISPPPRPPPPEKFTVLKGDDFFS